MSGWSTGDRGAPNDGDSLADDVVFEAGVAGGVRHWPSDPRKSRRLSGHLISAGNIVRQSGRRNSKALCESKRLFSSRLQKASLVTRGQGCCSDGRRLRCAPCFFEAPSLYIAAVNSMHCFEATSDGLCAM